MTDKLGFDLFFLNSGGGMGDRMRWKKKNVGSKRDEISFTFFFSANRVTKEGTGSVTGFIAYVRLSTGRRTNPTKEMGKGRKSGNTKRVGGVEGNTGCVGMRQAISTRILFFKKKLKKQTAYVLFFGFMHTLFSIANTGRNVSRVNN